MTKFLPAWMRNDFHSTTGQPIKNKDMIVHLLALLNQRSQDNKVKFWHVKAHVGETGNEGADVSRILTIGTVIPGKTLLIPRLTLAEDRFWQTQGQRYWTFLLIAQTGLLWKMRIGSKLQILLSPPVAWIAQPFLHRIRKVTTTPIPKLRTVSRVEYYRI